VDREGFLSSEKLTFTKPFAQPQAWENDHERPYQGPCPFFFAFSSLCAVQNPMEYIGAMLTLFRKQALNDLVLQAVKNIGYPEEDATVLTR
jgi:hypothetical protein